MHRDIELQAHGSVRIRQQRKREVPEHLSKFGLLLNGSWADADNGATGGGEQVVLLLERQAATFAGWGVVA